MHHLDLYPRITSYNVCYTKLLRKFVNVYDPAGGFQYKFGGLGINPGQFRSIWAMSVDEAAGEVYVADIETYSTSQPKMQVFDLAGKLRRSLLATTGFGPSPMIYFRNNFV